MKRILLFLLVVILSFLANHVIIAARQLNEGLLSNVPGTRGSSVPDRVPADVDTKKPRHDKKERTPKKLRRNRREETPDWLKPFDFTRVVDS